MSIATLISIYQDKMFLLFPIMTWVVSTFGFAFFAAPLTYIEWKRPQWAAKYRIQKNRKQKRVIIPSIKYSLSNSLLTLIFVVLTWPLIYKSPIHAGPMPAWYVHIIQLLFFIYLDDFIYYWMHRALHQGILYKKIHSIHHRVTVPCAIAAHYMHPIEFVLTTMNVLLGPMLVGAHVTTLWMWVLFRQWEAAEGHCGYDFPWNPSRLIPFYEGSGYHDYHHAKFFGNYSGFTGYLDRLLGTRSQGYNEYLENRKK